MVPGIIPLIPPPSMLKMVIRFPKVGGCNGTFVVSSIEYTKKKGVGDFLRLRN